MGFTEITFLFVFMPISIIIYLLAEKLFHNDKANNVILVIMSLLFYFWAGKETLLIFVVLIIFTYMAGLVVQGKNRLLFPVVLLIGVLAFYKYATMAASAINNLLNTDLITLRFVVPIGLSFVIFESISYVDDIYRGDAEPGTFLDCFTFLSINVHTSWKKWIVVTLQLKIFKLKR